VRSILRIHTNTEQYFLCAVLENKLMHFTQQHLQEATDSFHPSRRVKARFKWHGVETGLVSDTVSFPLLLLRLLADFSPAEELAAKSRCLRALSVLTAEGEICACGCSTHPASVTGLVKLCFRW